MDLKSVIARLRKEREELDVAISNLEHLERERRPNQGRPLNVVTKGATNGTKSQSQTS